MSVVAAPKNLVHGLHGVSWEEYLRLRQVPENRQLRMCYFEGTLELTSPSHPHEEMGTLIELLIFDWCDEHGLNIVPGGATTLKRGDLQYAVEADKSYHLQTADALRPGADLDLRIDPPPDLIVDVDITSSSRHRLPIYAALGVRELWIWRWDRLVVSGVTPVGDYAELGESVVLSGFPLAEARRLLAMWPTTSAVDLHRQFVSYLRDRAK